MIPVISGIEMNPRYDPFLSIPLTGWTSEDTTPISNPNQNRENIRAREQSIIQNPVNNTVNMPITDDDVDRWLPPVNRIGEWFIDDLNLNPNPNPNPNLIQISRPIGINTVGSRLGGGSWDIRTEPPNPSYAVSPW